MTPPTVALLVEQLRSPSPLVRQWAASQIGRLGPVAVDAIPALQAAGSDKNRKVRNEARLAMRRLESHNTTSRWKRFLKNLRQALAVPHA